MGFSIYDLRFSIVYIVPRLRPRSIINYPQRASYVCVEGCHSRRGGNPGLSIATIHHSVISTVAAGGMERSIQNRFLRAACPERSRTGPTFVGTPVGMTTGPRRGQNWLCFFKMPSDHFGFPPRAGELALFFQIPIRSSHRFPHSVS